MTPRRASRADRTDTDGTVFDSAAEMRRWHELQLLAKAGVIRGLQRQVAFPLYGYSIRRHISEPIKIRSPRYKRGRACVWTADFVYEENGQAVYEEFKGVWTEAARLRVGIAEACYGFEARVTGPAKMIKRRGIPRGE